MTEPAGQGRSTGHYRCFGDALADRVPRGASALAAVGYPLPLIEPVTREWPSDPWAALAEGLNDGSCGYVDRTLAGYVDYPPAVRSALATVLEPVRLNGLPAWLGAENAWPGDGAPRPGGKGAGARVREVLTAVRMDLVGGGPGRWGYVDAEGLFDFVRIAKADRDGKEVDLAPILRERGRGRVTLARLGVWPWVTADEDSGHLPRGWTGNSPARTPRAREIVRVLDGWLVDERARLART